LKQTANHNSNNQIGLSELLRMVRCYDSGTYRPCTEGVDVLAPGAKGIGPIFGDRRIISPTCCRSILPMQQVKFV